MEERLDDALNVLRSHCESQITLPLSNMDGSNGHSFSNASQSQPPSTIGLSPSRQSTMTQDHNLPETPVKLERSALPVTVSSEFLVKFRVLEVKFNCKFCLF